MAAIAIIVGTAGLLAAMSLWANRRFQAEDRLPLQWWLDTSGAGTAPRLLALAFLPVMTAICLAPAPFLAPKMGQAHLVVPILLGVGLVVTCLHALDIWIIDQTRARED